MLPPQGRYFHLLRARSSDGRLLGITTVMSVTPFASIKQMHGEGNHVGWDVSFYLAEDVDRGRVTAALLEAVAARSMYYGLYFGAMDDDIAAALPHLRHRLRETDYHLGRIDTSLLGDPAEFLADHKRLRRHIRDHQRAGGTIHVVEGPLDERSAEAVSRCIRSTYRHHGGWGRLLFKSYAQDACGTFNRICRDAVHIYSTLNGEINGCQTFVRHSRRLELSEGGFLRDRDNHHTYEAIIYASVVYAVEQGLESVGFGGIWNPAKDRYTDAAPRPPIYMLAVYRRGWQYRLFGDRVTALIVRYGFTGILAGGSGASRLISKRARPVA